MRSRKNTGEPKRAGLIPRPAMAESMLASAPTGIHQDLILFERKSFVIHTMHDGQSE